MEQTNTQQPNQPQGKGMGVAGFVISLVGLVLFLPVSIAVAASAVFGGGYGLGVFWIILCVLGTALSIMGMMKLGKTGGKRGLAITGMILGILASLLSVRLVMGISTIQEAGSGLGDKFKDAMEKGMSQSLDSLANDMNNTIDSTKNSQE